MAGAFAATSVSGGRPQRLLEANAAMDSLLLRQAVVVEGRQPADPATFGRLSRGFDDALSRGRDATHAGSRNRALLIEQATLADRWRSSAARAVLAPCEQRGQDVEERARLLDRFSARNRSRRLVLLFTAIGFVTLLTSTARSRRCGAGDAMPRVDEDKRLLLEDRRHRAAQEEFGRALQSAGRNCVRALRALEAPDEPRVLREQSRATSRHEA
jgi:hypothetical protein